MASRPFVHLHCHSHYSLLDGQNKLPDLVKQVKALGMPAIAVTDHGNMFGAVEFYAKAKAAGRLNEIPTNHNPRFAPVIHPTLQTGVEAMTVAAETWLAP